MSSSTSFLFQLKSYCTSLERDSQDLRKAVESRLAPEVSSTWSTVHALLSKADGLSAQVALAEDAILGPLETRLSQVRLEEV